MSDTPTEKRSEAAAKGETFDDLAALKFTPLTEAATGADEAKPEPEKPSSGQIIGGAVAAAREVFCIVTKLESPKVHLNDETAQKLGALWGPVLEKHGIDLHRYMGDYALEIAAVIGTLSIGASVRGAVIAEIAAKEAKDPALSISKTKPMPDIPADFKFSMQHPNARS